MVCASNANNILTDFINSGVYDKNRDFHLTMSPSMDILISSNLERLLYFTAGTEETAACMKKLNEVGKYEVSADAMDIIKQNFVGYFADENETAATLRKVYTDYGYLADTHTSVAFNCAEKYVNDSNDTKPMVVVSTASPYKFAADVYTSLYGEAPASALAALDELSLKSGTEIPYPLKGIGDRTVRFTDVIPSDEMWQAVERYIG
jgi:threonine synthase